MSDLTITERYILSLEQENKRLKSECCAYKKECNKDNCDCMYEEWHRMSEQNVILWNRIDKAIDYIEKFIPIDNDTILMRERQRDYLLDILKGSDKE